MDLGHRVWAQRSARAKRSIRAKWSLSAKRASLGAIALVMAMPACGQDADTHAWHLPAQSLAAALRAVAIASHRDIAAPAAILADRQAPALDGRYSTDDAVGRLLAGSGLRARPVGQALVIEPDDGSAVTPQAARNGEIVVTGSRIASAKSASNVVTVDRETMASAGRTTVDDVIRTIPENFSGGQNPGVGYNVPETSGVNQGGSSSVNLRGLGSDATLTLLDGHRLAYSAALQSIDIAAIPFEAIDRIEIVPDGASAIYGSDAVAGVVNVRLRHDFTGLETITKLGGSTDGGDFSQQFGVIAGTTWHDGGAFLAYEYDHNSAVTSDERDYARAVRPGLTLLPAMRQDNVAVSAHQSLAPDLRFAIDGLFGRRWTDLSYPLDAAADPAAGRATTSLYDTSYSVAPSLALDLPQAWSVLLQGSYGDSRTDYDGVDIVGGTRTNVGAGYYRNTGSSIELSATGHVLTLPGGVAKMAVGIGFRRNDFLRFTGSTSSQIEHAQDSYDAFGELNLPLLSHVTADAALRYERYPGIGAVVTPKLGGVVTVSDDLDLKASWGKSFRAPTLYQQYQPSFAYLLPASSLGGTHLPAGATALLSLGGNPNLKPERSTNWSATVDLHPRRIEGLDLALSYFEVDYRNRTVTPILFVSNALSNASYANFVTQAPTAAQQAAFIASAGSFTNVTAGSYDPGKVVAIVDNASVNAGRLRVHGVDAALGYKRPVGVATVHATLNLSYLDSRRQLSAGQAYEPLAGVIFNPPHLKGRGELGYAVGGLSLTADVEMIGPVRDTRESPSVHVAGMTPVDLTLRYRIKPGGLFGGFDLILATQNLFDERPALIATSLPYDTPYDSTNYTALGRTVSLSVSKSW